MQHKLYISIILHSGMQLEKLYKNAENEIEIKCS